MLFRQRIIASTSDVTISHKYDVVNAYTDRADIWRYGLARRLAARCREEAVAGRGAQGSQEFLDWEDRIAVPQEDDGRGSAELGLVLAAQPTDGQGADLLPGAGAVDLGGVAGPAGQGG